MKTLWHEKAWDEYLSLQVKDKTKLKKVNRLIEDIQRNGYNCAGKAEPLKYEYSGWWSVRIDKENRIVFRIQDGNLEILQCGTHYQDK